MEPILAVSPSGDPFSWLVANPKLLLLVFPAVVWLVNQVRAAGTARTAAQSGKAASGGDAAGAERTRRVQEEVRRRIAERRGMQAPAREPDQPRATVQARSPVQPPALAPAFAAAYAADRVAARAPASSSLFVTPGAVELMLELHDPAQLRRAIILREVLGPPVALR